MKKNKIISLLFSAVGLLGFSNVYAQEDSMTFKRYTNCADCREYIYADGRIEGNTPLKFAAFIKPEDKGKTVFFNSLGGSLDGGIKLGELIRENQMHTYLGNEYYTINEYGEKELVNKDPKCHSSCAYAFLGGVARRTEPDSKYGIHNFRNRNNSNNYLQEKLVDMHIEDYLRKMGVDRDYLYLTKSYENEDVYIMPMSARESLIVDNLVVPEKSWKLEYNALVNIVNVKNGFVEVNIKQLEPGAYVLTYIYTINNESFIPKNVDSLFQSNTLLNLKIDRTNFVLIPNENWKRIGKNIYEETYNLSKPLLMQMSKAQHITLIPQTTNELVNDEVSLSSEGINNIGRFIQRNP